MPPALQAALFDMDGVLTRTATVHFEAWRRTLDPVLATHGKDPQGRRPLTWEDYRAHVDGKPRRAGVTSLLGARGIALEDTAVDDIAHRKNALLGRLLDTAGVEVYPDAVAFARAFRDAGVATVLASSSRNAGRIAGAAGIESLFDARVDGRDLTALGLTGKPDPDLFLEACRRVAAPPAAAVLFEDAVSGVQAGRDAGIGLVVGIAREGDRSALARAGADLVVIELSETSPAALAAALERKAAGRDATREKRE